MSEEDKTFNVWWHAVGSSYEPIKGHNMEEHAKRIAYTAWMDRSVLISNDDE